MKKLFGILGLVGLFSFSVLFMQPKAYQVKAEEETTIVEPIVEEQSQPSLADEITQTCKDCIVFMQQLLSQPLVIAGVSTTVGALALLIIGKVFSGISKKKLGETNKKLEELVNQIKQSASQKDFNSLVEQKNQLVAILKEILPTIKNVKVKQNCLDLLEQLEPTKQEVVEFVKEETEIVKEDIKEETNEVVNDIADILKK